MYVVLNWFSLMQSVIKYHLVDRKKRYLAVGWPGLFHNNRFGRNTFSISRDPSRNHVINMTQSDGKDEVRLLVRLPYGYPPSSL